MQILLSKEFEFQMAHALARYPGKCRNLHGHNYRLIVTVASSTTLPNDPTVPLNSQSGMVMDFGEIKSMVEKCIIEPFDHALVVPEGSPFQHIEQTKLVVTPFEPTSENLLLHFASLLMPHLPQGVKLHALKLYETGSSAAELLL